jgi:hypothetical protein
VVRLLPAAEFTGPIKCEVRKVGYSGNYAYTAFSYVWGNLMITNPIFLEKIEVDVTINLAAALRHLRAKFCHDAPMMLWAERYASISVT